MSINFTSRAVYIAMYIRSSFESLHRCQNPGFGLLCLSSLVNPYPEFNTEQAKCNAQTRLPIYRVRISSWVSSWIFVLDFRVRIFLARFFGGVSNKFSVVLHNVLSAVLHIVLRSFQDGGERGWQTGNGNLV